MRNHRKLPLLKRLPLVFSLFSILFGPIHETSAQDTLYRENQVTDGLKCSSPLTPGMVSIEERRVNSDELKRWTERLDCDPWVKRYLESGGELYPYVGAVELDEIYPVIFIGDGRYIIIEGGVGYIPAISPDEELTYKGVGIR